MASKCPRPRNVKKSFQNGVPTKEKSIRADDLLKIRFFLRFRNESQKCAKTCIFERFSLIFGRKTYTGGVFTPKWFQNAPDHELSKNRPKTAFPQEKNQYGPVTCPKSDFFAFFQRIAKMCKKLYF
jgi:hypothetical protein